MDIPLLSYMNHHRVTDNINHKKKGKNILYQNIYCKIIYSLYTIFLMRLMQRPYTSNY